MCDGCASLCLQSAIGGWVFEGFTDKEEMDDVVCLSPWSGDVGCASLHVSSEIDLFTQQVTIILNVVLVGN